MSDWHPDNPNFRIEIPQDTRDRVQREIAAMNTRNENARRVWNGQQFRARLERRVTTHAAADHEARTAPPEVVHRRVNGVTVISRRLFYLRTSEDVKR